MEVLLNAQLRDPIKYKVMGYEISLRRQEAEMIEIISEQEAKEQAVQPDYHEGLGENMHLGEDELKQLALGKTSTVLPLINPISTIRLRKPPCPSTFTITPFSPVFNSDKRIVFLPFFSILWAKIILMSARHK